MRKTLLFIILSGAVLCSCVRDEEPTGPRTPELPAKAVIVHSPQDAYPGVLIVKFRPSVADSIEFAGTRTRSGELTSGLRKVDKVLGSVAAVSMERLFPHAGRREPLARSMGMHLWYEIRFDENAPLEKTALSLADISGIETVEYNVPVKRIGNPGNPAPYIEPVGPVLASAPSATRSMPFDDPMLADQWHYDNDGSLFEQAIAGADVNLFKAWEKCKGSPEVIVAVIDKGVDFEHPDLAPNMWVNETELNGQTGVDDDDNGYKDDIHGYDFYYNRGTLSIGDHGTHVAGTVAAVNGNGTGVCGVAGGSGNNDGVKIMSCVIFSPSDAGAGSAAIGKAMYYAANNGAVISQNSWGSPAGTYSSEDMWAYIASSEKAGIDYFIETAGYDVDDSGNKVYVGPLDGGLVVFAAGNDGHTAKTKKSYPAAYSPILSVAAMSADYTPSWFTCYGTWVDVTAPGGDESVGPDNRGTVLSTLPRTMESGYGYMQGTSMACPHVSGIAALAVSYALELNAHLTATDLKSIIESSTHNFDDYMVGKKTVRGYTVNMPDYKGLMGTGYVDAEMVLSQIDGMGSGNSAPQLKLDAGQQTTFEMAYWETRSVLFTVTDRNGDSWTVNLTDPDGMCTYSVEGSRLTVTVEGDNEKAGTHKASVYVTDDKGAKSDAYEITYTVIPNAAPTGKPLENLYFKTLNSQSSIDLTEHFSDPGDALSYTVEAFSVSTGNATDAVRTSVTDGQLTVEALKYGTCQVTVTAADRGGLALAQSFRITARDSASPMDLYPNPVGEYLNIRMGQNVEGTVKVRILSSNGAEVFNGYAPIAPFEPARIGVGSLARGPYTVEVSWKGAVYKDSIIKK